MALFGTAVALLLISLAALQLYIDHRRLSEGAMALTRNLALTVEAHSRAVLTGAMNRARAVGRGIDSAEPTRGQLFDALSQGITESPGLVVLDAEGGPLFSSVWIDHALEDGVRAALRRAVLEERVPLSAPIRLTETGQRMFFVGAAIENGDGALTGIAGSLIDPLALLGFFNALEIGEGGVVGIVREDGTVLARRPVEEALIKVPTRGPVEPKREEGSTRFVSRSDGIDRFWTYITLPEFRSTVYVAVAADPALAPWREQAWFLGGMVAVACVAVGMLTVGLMRQVERLGQAKAAADAARIRAEAANEAKTQFLASMSHELRTPLTGIIGFSDLLAESGPRPDQAAPLSHVRTAAALLKQLIDDLLDLSRIEAGKLPLEAQPCRLGDLIESCRALMAPAAQARGIGLGIHIGPDVPDRIVADPGRLRQVLLNLLNNAVKFTDRGTVSLVVERAESDGRPALAFTVRDTGIGITASEVEHLFTRFFQGAHRRGGTGLGLAIVRHLVDAMGGTITVDSLPGQGSRFRILVPLTIAASDVAVTKEQPAAGAPAHILVAEDAPINQQLVQAILERAGFQVTIVEDGQRALEAVQTGRFDLVLMDIRMPVMDGLTATRAIRALPPPAGSVPILALTADAFPGDLDRCREAGMNGHLAKPISPKTLVEVIRKHLTGAGPD